MVVESKMVMNTMGFESVTKSTTVHWVAPLDSHVTFAFETVLRKKKWWIFFPRGFGLRWIYIVILFGCFLFSRRSTCWDFVLFVCWKVGKMGFIISHCTLRIQIRPKKGISPYNPMTCGWDVSTINPSRSGGVWNS